MATAIEIDGSPADNERLAERVAAEHVQFIDLLARNGRVHCLTERLAWLTEEVETALSAQPDGALIRSALDRFLTDEPESGPIRVELYRCPDSSFRTLIRQRDGANPPAVLHLRRSVDLVNQTGPLQQAPVPKGEAVVMCSASGLVLGSSRGPIGLISGSRIVWAEHVSALRAVRHLKNALAAQQIATVTLPIREDELALFDAAFIVHADGISAVEGMADRALDVDHALLGDIRRAWEAAGWERP